MIPRLQQKYEQEILPALSEKFGRTNRLALPRLEKIVVNMGVGIAIQDKKFLEMAVDALTQITGQKPIISLALPRVRDFRGVNPDAFDGRGNYSLGLTEQLVFPELNPDKFTRVQGMNITMVTTTRSNDEARELLRLFGLPFRQEGATAAA